VVRGSLAHVPLGRACQILGIGRPSRTSPPSAVIRVARSGPAKDPFSDARCRAHRPLPATGESVTRSADIRRRGTGRRSWTRVLSLGVCRRPWRYLPTGGHPPPSLLAMAWRLRNARQRPTSPRRAGSFPVLLGHLAYERSVRVRAGASAHHGQLVASKPSPNCRPHPCQNRRSVASTPTSTDDGACSSKRSGDCSPRESLRLPSDRASEGEPTPGRDTRMDLGPW
jgi:hypothetical protein